MKPAAEESAMGGSTAPTVEAYVTATPPDPQRRDELLSRLNACVERGTVEELTVSIWPRAVSLTCSLPVESPVERVREFEQWAADNDVSLEPAFETRTVQSAILDCEECVLRLPTMCLACYHDGDLIHVAPCSTPDAHISVEMTVTALETEVDLVPQTIASGEISSRTAGR